MCSDDRSRATVLVRGLSNNEPAASRDLFPLVYERLRGVAQAFFNDQPRNHTLQPTALVHEAYIKMVDHELLDADDRVRFVRVAARAMRQILIDHARSRQAEKRGGGQWQRLTLDGISGGSAESPLDLLALDEALETLTDVDPRQAAVVELRFFGGLTVQEVAVALDVSTRTVDLDWRMAKAWLNRNLGGSHDTATP